MPNPSRRRSLLVAVALSTGLAAWGMPALAAGDDLSMGLGERFSRLDGNTNGFVSKAEAKAGRADEFTQLDKDGDGVLDRAEYPDKVLRFSAFDRDGDNRISQDEYVEKHMALFSLFDEDGDDEISMGEFAAARKTLRSQQTAQIGGQSLEPSPAPGTPEVSDAGQ